MSGSDEFSSYFQRERASAQMRTVIHMCNVLNNPEPYLWHIDDRHIAEDFYTMPEFDLFRTEWGINDRTADLTNYLGQAAIHRATLGGDLLRLSLVNYGESQLMPQDRQLLVDARRRPLSVNQVLPDPDIIVSTIGAVEEERPSTLINRFVERCIADLGDRAPNLVELKRLY